MKQLSPEMLEAYTLLLGGVDIALEEGECRLRVDEEHRKRLRDPKVLETAARSLRDLSVFLDELLEIPVCTGAGASWCPICGDCICADEEGNRDVINNACPLHGSASGHSELYGSALSANAQPPVDRNP